MNEAEELWEVEEESDEESTSILADADYSEAENKPRSTEINQRKMVKDAKAKN